MRFAKHAAKKVAILVERQVFIIFLRNIVRRRGNHQMNGAVGKLAHLFAALAENAIEKISSYWIFAFRE